MYACKLHVPSLFRQLAAQDQNEVLKHIDEIPIQLLRTKRADDDGRRWRRARPDRRRLRQSLDRSG